MKNPEHRYEPDPDRCSCGAEGTWMETGTHGCQAGGEWRGPVGQPVNAHGTPTCSDVDWLWALQDRLEAEESAETPDPAAVAKAGAAVETALHAYRLAHPERAAAR